MVRLTACSLVLAVGWRRVAVRKFISAVWARLGDVLRWASMSVAGRAASTPAIEALSQLVPEGGGAMEQEERAARRRNRKLAKRNAREVARVREQEGAKARKGGKKEQKGGNAAAQQPPVVSSCGRATLFGRPLKGDDKYTGAVLGDDGFVYAIPGSAKRVLKVLRIFELSSPHARTHTRARAHASPA